MSTRLAEALLSSGLPEESIRERARGIHQDLLEPRHRGQRKRSFEMSLARHHAPSIKHHGQGGGHKHEIVEAGPHPVKRKFPAWTWVCPCSRRWCRLPGLQVAAMAGHHSLQPSPGSLPLSTTLLLVGLPLAVLAIAVFWWRSRRHFRFYNWL